MDIKELTKEQVEDIEKTMTNAYKAYQITTDIYTTIISLISTIQASWATLKEYEEQSNEDLQMVIEYSQELKKYKEECIKVPETCRVWQGMARKVTCEGLLDRPCIPGIYVDGTTGKPTKREVKYPCTICPQYYNGVTKVDWVSSRGRKLTKEERAEIERLRKKNIEGYKEKSRLEKEKKQKQLHDKKLSEQQEKERVKKRIKKEIEKEKKNQK